MYNSQYNPIEHLNKNPTNEEYFEAVQEETNKNRRALIETLTGENKENFLMVEECVSRLEKSNIPFAMWVNPFGHDFDNKSGHWFWQYNKMHGKNSLFSEQGYKDMWLGVSFLLTTIMTWVTSAVCKNDTVAFFKDGATSPYIVYKNGKTMVQNDNKTDLGYPEQEK